MEEKREKKGKTQEDRIRQHATADSVFEYFANYKVISESGPCELHAKIRFLFSFPRKEILILESELSAMETLCQPLHHRLVLVK